MIVRVLVCRVLPAWNDTVPLAAVYSRPARASPSAVVHCTVAPSGGDGSAVTSNLTDLPPAPATMSASLTDSSVP